MHVDSDGAIRIKFDLLATSGTAHGKIYINGIAAGTDQTTTSSSYVTYSEDLSVNNGDTIELWCYNSIPANSNIRNFRLYYNKAPIISNATVDIN